MFENKLNSWGVFISLKCIVRHKEMKGVKITVPTFKMFEFQRLGDDSKSFACFAFKSPELNHRYNTILRNAKSCPGATSMK